MFPEINSAQQRLRESLQWSSNRNSPQCGWLLFFVSTYSDNLAFSCTLKVICSINIFINWLLLLPLLGLVLVWVKNNLVFLFISLWSRNLQTENLIEYAVVGDLGEYFYIWWLVVCLIPSHYTLRFKEVRPFVCGQNRVHSVSSTILIRSILYLHILSSNFARCVSCKGCHRIPKFEYLANFYNL